jgi:hypothetical protein
MQFFRKIHSQLVSPTKRPLLYLLNLAHLFHSFFSRRPKARQSECVFIFDPLTNAITYDFVWALHSAWLYFAGKGHKDFSVLIINAESELNSKLLLNDYKSAVTPSDMQKRLTKLIIPLAQLYGVAKSVYFLNPSSPHFRRLTSESRIYPFLYKYPSYRAPALTYSSLWRRLKSNLSIKELPLFSKRSLRPLETLDGVRYATFTLRSYGFEVARNTSSSDILSFIHACKILGLQPVLISDSRSEHQLECIDQHDLTLICPTISIFERASAYRYSVFNLFTASGPFSLSLFTPGSVSLMYNVGASESYSSSAKNLRRLYGWSYGDQPYLCFQSYIIWSQKINSLTVDQVLTGLDCLGACRA